VIISAASSRAAFPSLHCATTAIAMLYAFKYARTMFWSFLPIAVGLILATVYLRHHYVIDIIAGLALATFVYFVGPILEKYWCAHRLKAGTADISCESYKLNPK
jgi:membrane-associated phospholipid phosphatase